MVPGFSKFWVTRTAQVNRKSSHRTKRNVPNVKVLWQQKTYKKRVWSGKDKILGYGIFRRSC